MAAAQYAAIKQELSDMDTSESEQGHSLQPANLINLEERILQLCLEKPKGITDDMITQDQPLIDTERRMKALQRLLSQVNLSLSLSLSLSHARTHTHS